MLAQQLKLVLFLLFVAAANVGLAVTWKWGALAGFFLFLFSLFALQIAIPVLAYIASAWRRPPEAAGHSLWPILAAAAHEIFAFWKVFVVLQPFERFWMGADEVLTQSPDATPILLIPGYCCNRAMWRDFRRRLRASGRQVATVTLEPPFAGIDALAQKLEQRIGLLLAQTGARKIALVGHSMGGLVARAYLAQRGEEHVATLLTIGTPHRGSTLARLAAGRCGREMEPDSSWLAVLNRRESTIPTHCVWSAHDEFIVPQSSAGLPGARETVLPLYGHLALSQAPEVFQFLLDL